uniref:Uncharacterized protein n=1 Tax=viral metagenome TaxID=1070528 RepID=A0A6C0CMW2_9ZZZZ
MDVFSRNRTFLVIFFIIVFFVFFIYYHFQKSIVEYFNTYPYGWGNGVPIYINTEDKTPSYSTLKDILDTTSFSGAGQCSDICKNQEACVDSGDNWENQCSSEFVNGDCYCKFQKVPEEGFSALKDYKNIIAKIPDAVKPSWRDIVTQNKWVSMKRLRQKGKIHTWNDLKIEDVQNMAFSFWIFFREKQDSKRMKGANIFKIKTGNKNNINISAKRQRPVFNIQVNTDDGKEYDETPYTHNSDMTGGNEDGYNHTSSFITITVTNSKVDLYINGKWKNNFGKNPILPTDNNTLLILGSNVQSIIMKDFKIYNQTISSDNIKLLYEKIKHKGLFDYLEDRDSNIESFIGMPNIGLSYVYDNFNVFTSWFHNNNRKEGFNSSPVIINEYKVGTSDTILRSETNTKCNYSNGAKERASYQKNPHHDTYKIHAAYMYFGKDKNRRVDFTKEVRSVLETQSNRVSNLSEFNIDRKRKLYIEIIRPWRQKFTRLEYDYDPKTKFDWSIVSKKIKCINSDDKKWDGDKCVDLSSRYMCPSSGPTECVNFTAHVRMGRCSDSTRPEFKMDTITLADGSKRLIRYVDLDKSKNEHLEIKTDKSQETNTLFSKNGTTFVMWIKIDPSLRNITRNFCRILNFGNRKWRNIEDEICIAIGGDKSKDNLYLVADGQYTSDLGTQLLDNKWHHIAWVLKPEQEETQDTPLEKASWTMYHNGIELGKRNRKYPKNIERNTKIVGGPAVDWDAFWGPKIGEFEIYGKALDKNIIQSIYKYGIKS